MSDSLCGSLWETRLGSAFIRSASGPVHASRALGSVYLATMLKCAYPTSSPISMAQLALVSVASLATWKTSAFKWCARHRCAAKNVILDEEERLVSVPRVFVLIRVTVREFSTENV